MSEAHFGFVGYPFCCGRSRGMPQAVDALLTAGLVERLAEVAPITEYGCVLPPPLPKGVAQDPRAKNLLIVAQAVDRLVGLLASEDYWPVILGGDCTVILGSGRVLGQRFADLGVIFMDAHGDYNTPATTPSGFIDGMCLASAVGLGPSALTKHARLRPGRIVLFGGRDFDREEMELMRSSRVNLVDMAHIRKEGLTEAVQHTLQILDGKPVLLHIDLDVLDPSPHIGLPAVDVPAAGGLSWEELRQATAFWAKEGNLVGLEVTGYNPLLDKDKKWTGPIADLVSSIISGLQ